MNLNLDTATAFAVIGFLLPLVVAVVKKANWPDWVNGIAALVTYAAASLLMMFVTGQTIDPNSFITTLTLVATSGTVGYIALWKNTSLENSIVTNVLG
jgi:peptidoglycan/LPS O-acetylase OafA/YrhL